MIKTETIRKILAIAALYEKRLTALDVESIPMCISTGNSKIGHVLNVSTMPIKNCPNCANCKGFCYDVKACVRYPDTVINARMRNTVILQKSRDVFFQRIDAAMNRRRKNKYFRWHVAGDIIDYDYFSRMVDNARRHHDFAIWTYTKVYDIVNAWIDENGALPSNFHVMFSKWDGVPMNNPHNLPTFTCKLKNGNVDTDDAFFNATYHCPGNCDVCKRRKSGCIYGVSAWIDEH